MKRIPLFLFLCWACTPSKSYRLRFFVQDNQGKEVSKAWIHLDDKSLGETDASGFFVTTLPFSFGAQPKITAGKEDRQAYYAPYTERVEITPQTPSEILLTVTLYALPKMQPISPPVLAGSITPAVATTPVAPPPSTPVVAVSIVAPSAPIVVEKKPEPVSAPPAVTAPPVTEAKPVQVPSVAAASKMASPPPVSSTVPTSTEEVRLEPVPIPLAHPDPLLIIDPHSLTPVHALETASVSPAKEMKKSKPMVVAQKPAKVTKAKKGYRLEVHAYDSSSEKKGVSGVTVQVNGEAVGKTDTTGTCVYWFPGEKEDLLQVALQHAGSPDFHTQFVAVPDMQVEKMYPAKSTAHIGTIVRYEDASHVAQIHTKTPLHTGQTFSVLGLQSDVVGRRKTYGKIAEWTVESVDATGGRGTIRGTASRAQIQAGDLVVPLSLQASADTATPFR